MGITEAARATQEVNALAHPTTTHGALSWTIFVATTV
eukprot:CAMPEP_0203829620 /NCGR_PEP_ID=MMETSP0115-20131106/63948_1 /ASSEMBLY_ACC=CAM_ASM_000227 /TAXON_ID=33651 /ORGANISM="Bicosoecid sp, Strain ms1" /LENGTH=36 /DNA_ID= /DNA_START= /DNA_END= /DNA_ORIENTATION=